MAAKSESNEIRINRIYDAPVKAVWDAWVDPEQVAQWWGPRGFTLTNESKDVRTGGTWRYTMHGPDGVDYPNVTRYLEVEKHKRLVYDHGATDVTAPKFRVTVVFVEKAGRTHMEMSMRLPTPEEAKETRKFIKKAGGNSTWDRLAEYLTKQSTGSEQFVINRSFEAPIGVMFDMWTNPKHFSRWLAPTGMEMRFIRADIREGGEGFYEMTGNGMKMFGKVRYREMRRPDKIVYTQQFCDEKEGPARHPMAPTWPESMLTEVVLTEEGPNETRVTVTWQPHGTTVAEELRTFVEGRAGMTQGWTGSFDKLETYLEETSPSANP